jgi:hypothetical protein
MPTAFTSDFAKLSNGGRIYVPLIGTITVTGNQVFVQDRTGDLLTVIKLASAEDAELEMGILTEQLDNWETYQGEKKAGEPRKTNHR